MGCASCGKAGFLYQKCYGQDFDLVLGCGGKSVSVDDIYMSSIHLTVLIILFVYHIRRPFDGFTVSFIGALIYFIPGVYYIWDMQSVAAYFVWWLVLAIMTVYAFIFDARCGCLKKSSVSASGGYLYRDFLGYLALFAFLYILFRSGVGGFLSAKYGEIPGGNILLYYFWVTTLSFSVLASVNLQGKFFLMVGFFQFVVLLLSGDRTHFTLMLMAIFPTIQQLVPGKLIYTSVMEYKFKLLPLVMILGVVGVFGKFIYGAAMFAPELGVGRVVSLFFDSIGDIDFGGLLATLESYHVQDMLIRIVETGFNLPGSVPFDSLLSFIPFSGELGIDVHSQSNLIKETFFSDWDDSSGVGGNFWAEAYAVGGIAMVSVYAIVHSQIVYLLNKALFRSGPSLMPLITLLLAYVGFYINRCTSAQIAAHGKRVVIVFVLIYVFYAVFRKALSKKSVCIA